MVYYEDQQILIRSLQEDDAKAIADEEAKQGWPNTEGKYRIRLADQQSGAAIALLATYQGQVAGYLNVYLSAAHFGRADCCELVDFGVLEVFRCKGIGSKLMDVAEKIAASYADTVFIGVGLHSGYGSAQRMYIKRGYIPDGHGVWYKNEICNPYTCYCNDDDLNLRFSKKLY